MASKEPAPKLPPGVTLENTYIPYQQGQIYTHPKVEEVKKQLKKPSKAYGWEDDENSEKIRKIDTGSRQLAFGLNKGAGSQPPVQPQKEAAISSFTFMQSPTGIPPAPGVPNPSQGASEPAQSKTAFSRSDIMLKESPGLLETRLMADYLQPGGASTKMSKEEKASFMFKVKNLNKKIVAGCIIGCFKASEENSKIGKAISCMEALLESDDAIEYKSIFAKEGLGKLRELEGVEKMKSISKRIQAGICAITGEKPSKSEEAKQAPSKGNIAALDGIAETLLPAPKPVRNLAEDIASFVGASNPSPQEESKEKQKAPSPAQSHGAKKKLDAFALMGGNSTEEKPEGKKEGVADIFAKMEIKTTAKHSAPNVLDLLSDKPAPSSDAPPASSESSSAFTFITTAAASKSQVEADKSKAQSLYELQKNLKSMYETQQEYPAMPPQPRPSFGIGVPPRNVYYMPASQGIPGNLGGYNSQEMYENVGIHGPMQGLQVKPEVRPTQPKEPDKYFGFVDKELE